MNSNNSSNGLLFHLPMNAAPLSAGAASLPARVLAWQFAQFST